MLLRLASTGPAPLGCNFGFQIDPYSRRGSVLRRSLSSDRVPGSAWRTIRLVGHTPMSQDPARRTAQDGSHSFGGGVELTGQRSEPNDVRRLVTSVSTWPDDVETFAKSLSIGFTGRPCSPGAVPPTFPITWLASPELREVLFRSAYPQGPAIIHDTQTFEYVDRLERGTSYCLSIECDARRDRCELSGSVAEGNGNRVAQMRTTFRVITPDAVQAPFSAPSKERSIRVPDAMTVVDAAFIDHARVLAYVDAAHDDNPLHRDDTAARALGLAGAIIPGMLMFGLLGAAVAEWCADAHIIRLSGRFIAPLTIPQTLLIRRRVAREITTDRGREAIVRLQAGPENAPYACVVDGTVLLDNATANGLASLPNQCRGLPEAVP